MTGEIDFKGIRFEVDYGYYGEHGDGWNEPHEDAYVEVHAIRHCGEDMTELLKDDDLREIENNLQNSVEAKTEED